MVMLPVSGICALAVRCFDWLALNILNHRFHRYHVAEPDAGTRRDTEGVRA